MPLPPALPWKKPWHKPKPAKKQSANDKPNFALIDCGGEGQALVSDHRSGMPSPKDIVETARQGPIAGNQVRVEDRSVLVLLSR